MHGAERQLRYAAILTRHGVRSPTWTADRLNGYSAEPWPDWGVAPGYLTPHGQAAMKLLGGYDRAYLLQAGLLSGSCNDAARIYIWADTDQRTIASGRALAAGLLPDCQVDVHFLADGKHDPLFNPAKTDTNRAAVAVAGRIGGHPDALREVYGSAFRALERVLGKPLPPDDGDQPLSPASTLAEDFRLEYTNGMTGKQLGWGRLNASNLLEIMALHAAHADLTRRTRYVARARGSNLLSHLRASLRQAVEGTPASGAIGKADDRLLVVVGHDTNITNIAGMLDLSWLIPGYQRDDTPPGGALVFELWCASAGRDCVVHTYYMTQTPDQLREAQVLSLESPPAKAKVFVPACSGTDGDYSCSWSDFDHAVEAAIDPAFVLP
jgi:4-phytase/acid phosphatase